MVYRVPPDRAQDDHIEGLPLGTRGGILVRHNFPLDAVYEFNVVLLQNIVGYVPGLEWPHELEISVDGERVFLAEVGGPQDNKLSDTNLALTKETLDRWLRARVPVKAGFSIRTTSASHSCARAPPSQTSRCSRSRATSICRT